MDSLDKIILLLNAGYSKDEVKALLDSQEQEKEKQEPETETETEKEKQEPETETKEPEKDPKDEEIRKLKEELQKIKKDEQTRAAATTGVEKKTEPTAEELINYYSIRG